VAFLAGLYFSSKGCLGPRDVTTNGVASFDSAFFYLLGHTSSSRLCFAEYVVERHTESKIDCVLSVENVEKENRERKNKLL